MQRCSFVHGLVLCFSCALGAQNLGDYWVDGLTGLDVPGNGTSPGAPWKTITYALTQIPPVDPRTQSSNWYTLYIEGNQTYSPGTNGETLPIVPKYNVWMEGTFVGHGVMPRIAASAGGVGMAFDPGTRYERNPQTVRYLVFTNGRHGMTMGGTTQRRHRPRVQDCIFEGQTVSCVRILDADNSQGTDPRFFQSLFRSAPRGIEILASQDGAVIFPDVEECTFDGLRDAAIFLDDTSANGANVGGLFRSCTFSNCQRGVWVRSSRGAATTNFRVFSSSFRDIALEGVFMDIANPADPAATIERSSFLRCGTGVRYEGVLTPGPYVCTLMGNVAHSCATGFRVYLRGTGSARVDWSDNLASNCDVGFVGRCTSSGVGLLLTSSRDRALHNRVGMDLSSGFAATSSALRVDSAMLCGNTSVGLDLLGSSIPMQAHSLTLADNGVGLRSSNGQHAIDHCAFGGNGADIIGSPQVTYSCLQGTSIPGVGNLNLTDPQLVRPFFKLAPTSPCIDRGNIATPLPPTDYEGDPRASVSRPNGGALPDIGADEYRQLGSVRPYGVRGFGYFNYFPRITSQQTGVVIGGTIDVDLVDAIYPVFRVPATAAVLTMGLRDDSGALPFDLTDFGAPGSFTWNDLIAWVGPVPVSQAGTATLPIPVPRETLLVGTTFCFQWIALHPGTNSGGFATSDGLRVTVGS